MFDDFLAGLGEGDRRALQAVIDQVCALAPETAEGRSYGMPAFRYQDRPLLGFTVGKAHLSLFPFSPAAVEAVRHQLAGYSLSKGTVRFTVDKPVPPEAVVQLVQVRMSEIEGPERSG